MERLLEKDSFIKVLFETIPSWVFVLDPEWQVHAANKAAKEFTGWSIDKRHLERCGHVVGCMHHDEDPRGCGYTHSCITCIIRISALESIRGKSTHRKKGKIELSSGQTINVVVSSSSFQYEGHSYAAVIVEDISLIVELQGLIPICASCKRIRDDGGYWNRLEMYIENNSEAEFTHDICPDCIKDLYPTVAI